jgi:hypothetical protein
MRAFSMMVLAGSVLLMGEVGIAQVKTVPGVSVAETATIEAIEQSTRTLTIKNKDGNYETLQAPPEVKRFAELKVGDRITARYYDNVVVRFKKPGEPAVNIEHESVTPGTGQKPGGTAARQRTITATVVAIDPKVPSITVKGPNGWTYSRKVDDKKALAQVKVGDQLDITWSEAVLISVDSVK